MRTTILLLLLGGAPLLVGCPAGGAVGNDDHSGHDHGEEGDDHSAEGDDHGEESEDHAADDHGEESEDHAGHDHGEESDAQADWCAEHGLPESACTVCDPSLVEEYQAAGDWCAGHGFPESVCPTCNPQPEPGEAAGGHVDWCAEHGLPESACTVCDPSLVEEFQAAGDWCGEHGFPESACPTCNPPPAPAGASTVGTVHLTDAALSGSDIRLIDVRGGAIAVQLDVPAEIQFNPDRVAHVSSLVSGQIQAVSAAVGDRVEAGQILVELNSVELGQARAELSRARALLGVASQNRDRQERLRAEGISSERSLLEAELVYEEAEAERGAASSRLRVFGVSGGSGPALSLDSPIGGLVFERHATRGENVSPDETLFVVADVSSVWVTGRVYEQQVSRVVPGMAATLTLSAYPGRAWSGRVDFVGMALDEETRTLPIRVELDNPDGVLRPGLFGTLRLVSDTTARSNALVPLGAVQEVDGSPVVFVEGEHSGEFAAVRVALGPQDGRQVEVTDGLSPGQRVVVEGAFALKSELLRGDLGDGCAH